MLISARFIKKNPFFKAGGKVSAKEVKKVPLIFIPQMPGVYCHFFGAKNDGCVSLRMTRFKEIYNFLS
jgi:hypothetical protein